MTLGYLGDPHFVGYGRGHLRDEPGGEPLLRDELIGKVLIDDDEERTIQEGSPLRLEEGYRLEVVEVDSRGEKVSIALLRDGVLRTLPWWSRRSQMPRLHTGAISTRGRWQAKISS